MSQIIATEVTVRVPENLSVSEELPSGIEDELAQLEVLSDELLWRIARSHLTPLQANKLERIHLKAQRQPLTTAERKHEQALVHEYERVLLLRARASRLFKDRGINITTTKSSLEYVPTSS